MKLKGVSAKKLKGKNKKKKEATLKRMEITRKKDSAHLRDIIKIKLDWAIAEKKQGLNQQRQLQAQIHRLEGIILFCQDILNPQREQSKN